MKAKEYAEIIIDGNLKNTINEAMLQVISMMLKECSDIAHARNANHVTSVNAVFLEQETKWYSVCNKVNDHFDMKILKKSGYRAMVYKAYKDTPEMKELPFFRTRCPIND